MLDLGLEKATLSAGCFWGVQFYFDQIPGVIMSRVGYTGGHTEHPTYDLVNSQTTGHSQAIEIQFDADLIGFDTILKHFFRIHDPTQVGGQAGYIGDQYRSAIYYHNDDQKVMSQIIMESLKSHFKKPMITKLEPVSVFYEAEPEHQKHTQDTGEGMFHVPYENLH